MAHAVYWPVTGGSAQGLRLGGLVNLEWRASPRWWLVAELAGQRVVSGEVPVHGGMVTLGLGARWRVL